MVQVISCLNVLGVHVAVCDQKVILRLVGQQRSHADGVA